MKSYTERVNLYKKFTRDATTDNVALGVQFMNDSDRVIANIKGGRHPWLAFTDTLVSLPGTNIYPVPARVRKIIDGFVTVGTTQYPLRFIYDTDEWNRVVRANLGNSDNSLFAFVENHRILLSPGTATGGNVITIRGRRKLRDLVSPDYTAGTIASVTKGAYTVTGTGTAWTAAMGFRWIRITAGDAAGTGDGYWYEIASVESATSLTLLAPYEGTTIAGGTAAYTIGQMSHIPEDYDTAPVYRAAALFWLMKDDMNKSNMYWNLYDGGMEASRGKMDTPGGLIGQMLESYGESTEGAYIPPRDSFNDVDNNIPPRYPITT